MRKLNTIRKVNLDDLRTQYNRLQQDFLFAEEHLAEQLRDITEEDLTDLTEDHVKCPQVCTRIPVLFLLCSINFSTPSYGTSHNFDNPSRSNRQYCIDIVSA